jgi:hypothetical protein
MMMRSRTTLPPEGLWWPRTGEGGSVSLKEQRIQWLENWIKNLRSDPTFGKGGFHGDNLQRCVKASEERLAKLKAEPGDGGAA